MLVVGCWLLVVGCWLLVVENNVFIMDNTSYFKSKKSNNPFVSFGIGIIIFKY
ncbi:Potassium uptake protein TrkH [Winogradskyella psychrotolerans RS-3]|uniref:Potassium uptake protein TrkH n=1 Tax=Winogradskyella psychrotolerans RS-3 TaxID=641526 RepID=S7VWB2_9FLAO|nr:Potassium uptake protein TrkH [Winogradskyella psychrotolerans RS-3]